MMRIDANPVGQALPQTERAATHTAPGPNAQAAASSAFGQDEAELSSAQAQVQTWTAEAVQFPEVRQEKVNALRQVVEDGSYGPSSDQIADAMLMHMAVMPAA